MEWDGGDEGGGLRGGYGGNGAVSESWGDGWGVLCM